VGYQVSPLYKRRGKTVVLHMLILRHVNGEPKEYSEMNDSKHSPTLIYSQFLPERNLNVTAVPKYFNFSESAL
jgi:hypothetical protein